MVDVRQADDAAAPAADHQRAERVADREGGGAEEVVAVHLLAFQADLVIGLGEVAPAVDDAGHGLAQFHDDGAVLDDDLAAAGVVGGLPAVERLAVEQLLPAGLVGGGLLGGRLGRGVRGDGQQANGQGGG